MALEAEQRQLSAAWAIMSCQLIQFTFSILYPIAHTLQARIFHSLIWTRLAQLLHRFIYIIVIQVH